MYKTKILLTAILVTLSFNAFADSPRERALGIGTQNNDSIFYNPTGKKIEVYPGIWAKKPITSSSNPEGTEVYPGVWKKEGGIKKNIKNEKVDSKKKYTINRNTGGSGRNNSQRTSSNRTSKPNLKENSGSKNRNSNGLNIREAESSAKTPSAESLLIN